MPILIVNSDDYARTDEISRGIRFGHSHGIVTSTTIMMNSQNAQESLRLALEQTPSLGLGVHLNLTYGSPILAPDRVPTLVGRDGKFHSREKILRREVELDRQDVGAEWRAQIEAFAAQAGLPDHLDSHHHIALLNDDLWTCALRLAQEYGCGMRPPLPADLTAAELEQLLPESSIEFISSQASQLLHESGVKAPNRFLVSFYGQGVNEKHLYELLSEPTAGVTELMCHCGFSSPELEMSSSYRQMREEELQLLTSTGLKAHLKEVGWQLGSYRDTWIDQAGLS
jgi:predicted glycoside hydrolase/deacetylase ChbG (UPF0249 family)